MRPELVVRKASTREEKSSTKEEKSSTKEDYYEVQVKLREAGHFVGSFTYSGKCLGPASFTIISLNGED